MALQISVTTDYGDSYPAVYARIEKVELSNTYGGMRTAIISVSFFKDITAKNGGKIPYIQKDYTMSALSDLQTYYINASANPLASSYVYLKTLPDFAGAIDA